MNGPILYCGDTDQTSAASYLSGLMASYGWDFDYVPSHIPMTPELLGIDRRLLILSDYPAAMFDADCQQIAVNLIRQGCGLLMIGGWESFHGYGGNWDGTHLGNLLPVEISHSDDRNNFPQSAFLLPTVDHEILADLPWSVCPPAIGGMNCVRPKSTSTTLLTATRFRVSANKQATSSSASRWAFDAAETLPALVVGEFGSARCAAFMSDVAPHWVGGFVDWGDRRVTSQAPNSIAIEVGCDYARFWQQLLQWTGKF